MNKNRYFMGAIAILVALVCYFGLYTNLISLYQRLINVNNDSMTAAREGLLNEFSMAEDVLTILIQTDPIQNMDAKQIHAMFSRIDKNTTEFLNMMVLNSHGVVIEAMTDKPIHAKLSDNEGVRKALAGQKNLSGLIYAEKSKSWMVSFKVPIVSNKVQSVPNNPKVIGVLLATMSLNHIREYCISYPMQNDAYVVLLDNTGKVIYHPDSNFRQNASIRQTLFPQINGRSLGQFTAKSPITGERTLYKYEKLGKYGWYILLAQPTERIYYALITETLKIVGALLLSIILLNLSLKYYRLEEKRAQVEMENKLGKLEVVGQIAAGVAHEIRNPLTTLKGFLQLMAMKKRDTQDTEHIGIMLKEIEQIEDISQEFLSLAKPIAPVLVLYDINKVVEHVAKIFVNNVFPCEATIELELSPIPPMVMADPGQVRQVVINLVKNAMEACPEDGRVLLRTAIFADKVVLQVADTGSGIAAEVKEKLGTPFFTTKENGTGLGLTVCLRIIQSLGGRIEFDSKPFK